MGARLRIRQGGFVIFLTIAFTFWGAGEASAHTRKYIFTEEYRTIPKGGFEIESFVKSKVPNHRRPNVNTFEFQEELEYGLTDHLTLAHYEVWERVNRRNQDDDTAYKSFKFEGKHRLGEKGKYWLDPLLYLEWITEPRRTKNKNKLESKLVLSKDFGNFNLTYNQIMENRLGTGGRSEHKYTFGANYEFPWGIHAGVELKGDWWRPGSHKNQLALGPTLAWEGSYFWVATGVAFGANHHADDYEARLIVGVPF